MVNNPKTVDDFLAAQATFGGKEFDPPLEPLSDRSDTSSWLMVLGGIMLFFCIVNPPDQFSASLWDRSRGPIGLGLLVIGFVLRISAKKRKERHARECSERSKARSKAWEDDFRARAPKEAAAWDRYCKMLDVCDDALKAVIYARPKDVDRLSALLEVSQDDWVSWAPTHSLFYLDRAADTSSHLRDRLKQAAAIGIVFEGQRYDTEEDDTFCSLGAHYYETCSRKLEDFRERDNFAARCHESRPGRDPDSPDHAYRRYLSIESSVRDYLGLGAD